MRHHVGYAIEAEQTKTIAIALLPTSTHCFVASGMARKVNRSPSFVRSGLRKQLPVVASLIQVLCYGEIAED